MHHYKFLIAALASAGFGFSQEIKDERALVDEVGLEANTGLPYLIGLGLNYSLKLRGVPVYPSLTLKLGTGPIVKYEWLIGLNYRKEFNLAYSINFGQSGGQTFVLDTHAGQPNKFVGLAANFQRKKYIGSSKYRCFTQVIGIDFKKQIVASKNPEFYLFPYFELGLIFMVI